MTKNPSEPEMDGDQCLKSQNLYKKRRFFLASEKLRIFGIVWHNQKHTNLEILWDTRDFDARLKCCEENTNVVATPCLFVARKRHNFDGHLLLEKVIESGSFCVVQENHVSHFLASLGKTPEQIEKIISHVNVISVPCTEIFLQQCLAQSLNITADGFTSAAITGTNGKTSVVQIAGDTLQELLGCSVLRLGTLGIQIGKTRKESPYPTMPDVPGFMTSLAEAQEQNINHLIFEATSIGLVEKRMGAWLVDVAVFTNLTQDHLDYHKTMNAYSEAKELLFIDHLKPNARVIVNTDDPKWETFAARGANKKRVLIGYGRKTKASSFFENAKVQNNYNQALFLNYEVHETSARGIQGTLTLYHSSSEIKEHSPYTSMLVGNFQHENLAAAVALLLGLGFSLSEVVAKVCLFRGIPGRLERVFSTKHEASTIPTVLVDYAHSPDALEKVLNTGQQLTREHGRLLCVFGCGGDRDATKRPIMGAIASRLATNCIVTSDNPRTENPRTIIEEIVAGIDPNTKTTIEINRREAIRKAIFSSQPEDVIIIAGKGHEDYEIHGTVKTHFSDVEVAREFLDMLN